MTVITADLVKELRERTGAGMMECKKALVAVKGDIELAIDEMRKTGQAKADKKASRVAAEGVVVIKTSGNKVAMVEINCETDFVARDASFKQFAEQVLETVLATEIADIAQLAQTKVVSGEGTVDEVRRNLITKLGENINVRRVAVQKTTGLWGTYNHGGRIGVIVELKGGSDELAKDIAMHIAASRPLVVSQDQVPADVIAKEKEIFIAQSKESGKPMEIIEKMIQGRLHKFLDEMSLVGQAFVKDPALKVSALLKQHKAEVHGFTRFTVGEGIEKEQKDFASEVMAQVNGG